MNLAITRIASVAKSLQIFSVPVRNASKKASGGKRNPKASKGQSRGLKVQEGHQVKKHDIIATQIRPNWLAGMNVEMKGNLALYSMKQGRIIITCETPELDLNHFINQRIYVGREGQKFFKKYVHVIPDQQHTRFKLIAQV